MPGFFLPKFSVLLLTTSASDSQAISFFSTAMLVTHRKAVTSRWREADVAADNYGWAELAVRDLRKRDDSLGF